MVLKTQKSKKQKLLQKSQKAKKFLKTKPKSKSKIKPKSKSKSRKSEYPSSSSNPNPQNPLSDSESESKFDPKDLQELLEPYTKGQLIDLIATAAVKNGSLLSVIRRHADSDVSHRKIFVHGLAWETTRQTLVSAFEPFGEIEDCHVVVDKSTGKCKGYGFVVFKTRKEASKALKEPRKKINDRVASCQLAAIGVGKDADQGARKIYVTNVPKVVDREKLKHFFEKYGEIEVGPIGFDVNTGNSRGFALFLYKTEDGAKKALEEPHKIFEGQQLYCQKAAEGKSKQKNVKEAVQLQGTQQVQNTPPVTTQSFPFYGQNMGLSNQVYGGLLGNSINTLVAATALSQGALPRGPVGAVGGLGGSSSSVLESFGAGQGVQHAYPNVQIGQLGAGSGPGPAATGAFPGYPSYIWYDLFYLLIYVLLQYIVYYAFKFFLLALYFEYSICCLYFHRSIGLNTCPFPWFDLHLFILEAYGLLILV